MQSNFQFFYKPENDIGRLLFSHFRITLCDTTCSLTDLTYLSVTLQTCSMAASAASAPPLTHQAKWRESRPLRPATRPLLPSRICLRSEHGRARDPMKDWNQIASIQGISFLLRPSTSPLLRPGFRGMFCFWAAGFITTIWKTGMFVWRKLMPWMCVCTCMR